MSDPEVSKTEKGRLEEEEEVDSSFLSKIKIDTQPQDDDDKDIESILNKGDDDYIPKTELDSNIEKLVEKLQLLDTQEALVAEKAKNKAEQHGEERKIRYKRKNIQEKLKNLTFRREIQKFKSLPSTPKKKSIKSVDDSLKFKVPDSKLASLTLDQGKEQEYYRLMAIANSYRCRIENLYQELENKIEELDDSLSEYEREEKQLEIQSKIETLKSFISEYQKRNNELQLIADVKDGPKLLKSLENILDTANIIFL